MAQGVTIQITADGSGVTQETAKVRTNLSAAFSAIQQQLAQMASVSTQGSSAIVQGLESVTKATQTTARATQAMAKDMQAAMRGIKTSSDEAGASTRTLTSGLSGLASRLAAGFGILELGRSFLTAALAMDTARLSLVAVTGSTQAAAKEMTTLQALAEKTGIGVDELSKQWAGLFAATQGTAGRLEAAREVFSTLIETGARLGKSTAQIGNAMYGLTQLAGGTTVQLDELARQIGDQLPGVMPALARELGVTQEELRKLATEGKLLVDDVLPAMARAIKSLTSGDGPITTASAEFGRMRTAWTNLMDTLAQSGALAAVTTAVQGITSAVKFATQAIKDMRAVMGGGDEETKSLLRSAAIHKEMTEIQRLIERTTETQPPSAGREAGLQKLQSRLESLKAEAVEVNKSLDALSAPPSGGAPGPSAAEKERAAQLKFLQDLKKTPAEVKKAIDDINKQLSALQSGDVTFLKALGLDPNDPQFKQQLTAFRDTLMTEREKLQDQLLGIDRKGAAKAAHDAEAEAKRRAAIEQKAMEQSLQTQEALIAESFDARRRLIDAQFSDDLAREPMRVKELSAIRTAELQASTVEEARFIEQVRIDSLSRQMLTAEEFAAKREAIIKRTGEVELKISEQTLQQQIKDAENLVSLTERVNDQILDRDEKMQAERTRVLERELDQQQRAYERFSEQVVGFLDNIFQGLLNGTLNAVNFFKQLLIRQLSNIAANVLGPLVTSLSSAVVGGIAGILPGGLGGAVQSAIGLAGAARGRGLGLGEGVGLLASLRTVGSGFLDTFGGLTTAVDALTSTYVMAASRISQMFGGSGVVGVWNEGVTVTGATNIGTTGAVGAGLGIAGGMAALGLGIKGALEASNNAAKAAYAASAAAGAFAAGVASYGALMGAAVVTAGGTGWTGIGLIVAAALAVVATVLDRVIKPEGPTLAVGAPGGLNIGAAGGKLQVQGDLGSRIFRKDDVDPAMARGVQAQMEKGITAAVISVIDMINAIALKPEALLGPTQEALQHTLNSIQTLNSSNAKKMEQDVLEQLRFINVQVVAGMLDPLNQAFDQLRDLGTLTEQLERLPATTKGMVDIFSNLQKELDNISKVQNTDVLRQLSGVRSQVENFGNRIAGTAGQIAESIVNQLVDELTKSLGKLDRSLAEQITDFSTLMQTSVRAMTILRSTKDILEQSGLGGGAVGNQIDRLATATANASARISTQIVSTALAGLAANLDQILIQPIRVQATTINSLFNDSLAALAALQVQWNQLNAMSIDTTGLQQQFSRLLGGLLSTAFTVLRQAFSSGSFADFLGVLVSIPDDLASLNPQLAQLKQLGTIFAQVVGPMDQAIMTLEDGLRTTGERVTFTAGQITDLRGAIADAGNAVDKVIPLYAQLAQAIQANAAAQIAVANEVADAQIKAANAAADAQIQAIKAVADAQIAGINAWADAWIKAINDAADTQIAGINAWADAWTKAVNDAVDKQRALLNEWVDTMTTAVNTWADRAQTTASQLRDVTAVIMAEQSPEAQRQALLEQEAKLAAVAFSGGPGSQQAMGELINVEKQLLALAKQSDDLKLQQESIDKLKYLQKILTDQLVKMTGQSDPILAQIAISETQKLYLKAIADFNTKYGQYLTEVQQAYLKAIAEEAARQTKAVEESRTKYISAVEISRDAQVLAINTARDAQIKAIEEARDAQVRAIESARDAQVTAIKVDLINQLKVLEAALREVFASQPVVRVIAAQRGGIVGIASGQYYAQGGMVPAMLEPGERVFNPPLAGVQEGALVTMNRAFPRFSTGGFTVPGSGAGDTVPAMLPRGAFVLNRRASGALGYQGGGSVSSAPSRTEVHHHYYSFPHLTVRSQADLEYIKNALREIERRRMSR